MIFGTPSPTPANVPPIVDDPDDGETLWALVRRSPIGGYSVVIGLISQDFVPEVDVDTDAQYNTLAGACAFARGAGYWSCHPEVYRKQTQMMRGLF